MEPGFNLDGGVVNMTRATEALSPWLNHPRKTIIKVEVLVVAAAVLLLLQLILGSCKRRWHRSFLKYGLQVCNGIMFPLIVYTLGTMQSSPIKNSLYPVWAAFLIMASAGTTPVRQYDFYDNFYMKLVQVFGEYLRDFFYATMFILLMDPSPYDLKTVMNDPKQLFTFKYRASSRCVMVLVMVVSVTKFNSSYCLVVSGYKRKRSLFVTKKSCRTEVAEAVTREGSVASRIKGCTHAVSYHLLRPVTIDQIRDYYGNLTDGNALKDLCLSYDLFQCLLRQHYFGLVVHLETGRLNAHDLAFKKVLSSEEGFERAFRVIEVELGFCYDFFFTKYYHIFASMTSLVPGPSIVPLVPLVLLKIIFILIVGLFAIRKSLVLPNPIIEVQNSKADLIITLLLLGIALLVELVQAAFYLASNWAQVSLACMHLKKCCNETNSFIFGKLTGFLRMVMISGQLRNKINQHSIIFQWKQPGPVEVSDAMKKAIARSLSSAYRNNNITTNGAIFVRLLQNLMFDEYSWALKDLSQLKVMLIWHIATEYCEYDVSDDLSNGTTGNSNHRGAHLFGYVLQLFYQDPRRNRIARDGHRGVAVHLSRYRAYLIGFIPELLPYHEADIAELAHKVMEEHEELFGSSYKHSEIYNKMKEEEEGDPRKMFQKGVKLGKQLKSQPDADRLEVLKDFWSETIIHVAASHYTTVQRMQHLENGGEFLTHVWALLAHAGIMMKLSRKREQEAKDNPGSGTSAAV